MRGKIGFNYDLRRALNGGQKSAIRRAFNNLAQHKNQRFIKPPHKPGESDLSYRRRLNALRRAAGQDNLPSTQGVWIDAMASDKFRTTKNQISILKRTPAGRSFREVFIPVMPPREIFRRFPNARRVRPSFHGFRSAVSVENEEDLEALLTRWDNQYTSAVANLTGYIIEI